MATTTDDVRRLRPDRVPPHNLEAEESVLGAMMLSAEAIADVVEVVRPEDF
ncbi:MAG TPA: DnaB-like helicase N-terminal domain-containing protein, partial [Actinomycetota bacterium]|nr:DnaB-like helicase N-terminal domain-containing protein [Actinomycetota bacterium]